MKLQTLQLTIRFLAPYWQYLRFMMLNLISLFRGERGLFSVTLKPSFAGLAGVLLLTSAPASADLCSWYMSSPEPSLSSIKYQSQGFLKQTASVSGPGFQISGRRVAVPYQLPTRNIHGQLHNIALNIRTDDGSEFLVITRDLHKDSLPRGKETVTGLETLAGRQAHLQERADAREFYRILPDVWQVAINNPARMRNFKIYADRNVLVIPTVPTMNRIISQMKDVKFRFREWRSLTAAGQKYEADSFLEAMSKGEILVGTKDEYFSHDYLDDHFIGAFMLPPEFVERFVHFSRFVQAVLQDSELRKDYQFTQAREALSIFWDRFTAELAETDLDIHDYGGGRATERTQEWKLSQRANLLAFASQATATSALLPAGTVYSDVLGLSLSFQELVDWFLTKPALLDNYRTDESRQRIIAIAQKVGFDLEKGFLAQPRR